MSQQKILPHRTADWNGYSIDELRYMRAYTAARIEIKRDRLTQRVAALKKGGIGSQGTGSMTSRLLGAIGYVDMALIGWKISRRLFKTMRILRRK